MVETVPSQMGAKEGAKGNDCALPLIPYDLIAMIWGRKYIVLASVAVAVVLGAALTWATPRLYRYVSALRIGELVLPAFVRPESQAEILAELAFVRPESQAEILAELRNIYLPFATADYIAKHPAERQQYQVRIGGVQGSGVVWLRATGPASYEGAYISIMQSVITRVIHANNAIIAPFQAQYQANEEKARIELRGLRDDKIFHSQVMKLQYAIQKAQSRLEKLKITARVMKERAGRYRKAVRLVANEINKLGVLVAEQRKERGEALREKVRSAERAMTLLIIDKNLDSSTERLFQLRQRRAVVLPSAEQALLGEIVGNRRAQTDQELKISMLRAQLGSLYVSHRNRVATQEQAVVMLSARAAQQRNAVVLQTPIRLSQPISSHWFGRIVLAAIGGLTFGIIVAFVLEVSVRCRREQYGSGNPAE